MGFRPSTLKLPRWTMRYGLRQGGEVEDSADGFIIEAAGRSRFRRAFRCRGLGRTHGANNGWPPLQLSWIIGLASCPLPTKTLTIDINRRFCQIRLRDTASCTLPDPSRQPLAASQVSQFFSISNYQIFPGCASSTPSTSWISRNGRACVSSWHVRLQRRITVGSCEPCVTRFAAPQVFAGRECSRWTRNGARFGQRMFSFCLCTRKTTACGCGSPCL